MDPIVAFPPLVRPGAEDLYGLLGVRDLEDALGSPAAGAGGAVGVIDIDVRFRQPAANIGQRTGPVGQVDKQHVRLGGGQVQRGQGGPQPFGVFGFIIDACYSGGFWTSDPGDDGDLSRLSNAALIASAAEEYPGVYLRSSGNMLWTDWVLLPHMFASLTFSDFQGLWAQGVFNTQLYANVDSSDLGFTGELLEWDFVPFVPAFNHSNDYDSSCPVAAGGDDTDIDGHADPCDNCPDDFNPDQVDSDQDGVGDACDGCPNTPSGEHADINGCACSQLDDDGDGIDNCLDACPETPPGAPVGTHGCPLTPGDFDNDGDVDQDDFGHMQACLGEDAAGGCANADLDGSSDIDQTDLAVFRRCMRGANVPVDPNCAN